MKKPVRRSSKKSPDAGREKSSRPDSRSERPSRRPASDRRSVGKGKKRPPEIELKSALPRLNQYIARAGVCSRREADELIVSGQISINGQVVRALGVRVQENDLVRYENKVLRGEQPVYVLLNKPKGFLSTVSDDRGRKTVMNLVRKACTERIYPVGRLDRETTGLLLFTNDGDLAKNLTHPSGMVKKIYHVHLDRPLLETDMDKIQEGIELEDGLIKPDVINYVLEATDGTQVGVQLHAGRNRIVRRMFEHLGYKVMKLDRVLFANLTKKDLPRGKWRFLKDKEVSMLKQIGGKKSKLNNRPAS